MREPYEFLTVNRNKKRGPFVIKRDGVMIGFGYATHLDAGRAAANSEQAVRQVFDRITVHRKTD